MVSENFAKITVNIVGLEETVKLVEEAMKVAFFAGFQMSDKIWRNEVGEEAAAILSGSPAFEDHEIQHRFDVWVGEFRRERESEKAVAELRKKLEGE